MALTKRQIKARLRALETERVALRRALDEKMRAQRVACSECGKGTRVDRLVYIQTHFYIEPHGCTGGDYWREGDGAYSCPKCGVRNRLYNRPDVVKLKRYFASVEKEHKR